MKKIINNKLYNTDTAKEIGSWASSDYVDSFDYNDETLYRKRTGEFFFHRCWYGGSDIRPATYSDAREWSERHLTVEEYESVFGDVSEDDSRSVLSISLPTSVSEKIRKNAAEAELTISSYIASLIS